MENGSACTKDFQKVLGLYPIRWKEKVLINIALGMYFKEKKLTNQLCWVHRIKVSLVRMTLVVLSDDVVDTNGGVAVVYIEATS